MKHARNNSWILAVAATAVFLINSGCNGGAAAPPPPPPAITVAIAPSGAQFVDQGQSIKFTANLSNDSSNKGVNWTLTQNGASCSPGCGTISPASTASGAPATYTAPAAVNANLQFNVTATSVADTSKSQTDVITAVPPPALNNPAQLPAATVGQVYSYQLTEAGGVLPIAWSITSGSLPAGLTLNSSTGVISGTPTTASQVIPAGPKAAAVQPNVTPSSFNVQGCDSGSPQLCNAQTITLLINSAATPDFSLSASPSSVNVAQGASGTATITINPTNGFNQTVSLTASGLPNGVTASFSAVANNSSILTLSASAAAATVTVTVTITGASGNLSHTSTISLTVTSSGSNLTIMFGQAPPPSLATGATALVSATISNDPANGGADWAVACGSSDCGSFNPAHTPSGATTTYMAPASVPSGGNVTITAKATSNPSQSVMQVVNITSELAGNIPRFVYVNDTSTISTLAVDAFTGQLRARGYISPYPNKVGPQVDDNPMVLDRAGNILYLQTADANTGAPEYLAYKIDAKGGSLTPLTGAPFSVGFPPLSSVVDSTGHYLFALEFPTVSSTVVQVFAIDQVTRALAEVPGSPFNVSLTCSVSGSVQLLVHPSGKFLYIAGQSGGNPGTCGYAVDTASGKLTPIPGSPFPPVDNPPGVAMDPLGRFIFFGQNKAVGINQVVPGVSVLAIDATGALSLVPGSPFLAPVPVNDNSWSIAVDPAGEFLYLSTQYFSNSIYAYQIQTNGKLWPYDSAVFTAPFTGEDLFIDPSGSFLYAVPNQGSGPSPLAPYISIFSLGNLATAPTNTWPLPAVDSFRVKGGGGFYLTFVTGAASDAFTPSFSYVANSAENDVSAYAINANTGALTSVPGSPYGSGKKPVSIAADLASTRAYVADTTDNTLSGYSINTSTGALSAIAGSPFATGNGPAAAAVDSSGSFAYALDTQAQTINQFAISSTGALTSLDSACGGTVTLEAAPSSLAIEPAGVIAYATTAGANQLDAFLIFPLNDPIGGCLNPHNGTEASVATGTSPSSVAVHPSGNFVYVSNAGSNDISAFAVRGYPGNLSLVPVSGSPFAVGSSPVSVTVDPTGRFLYAANQNSNDVSAFTIDKLTGVLTPVGSSTFAAGTAPASVAADTSGALLYVANKGSNNVSAFAIDPATGKLIQVTGSPFLSGLGPSSLTTTGAIGDGPVPPPPATPPNPPPPPPPGADFTVSIAPATQEIVWGKSATYTVTVQSVNGLSGIVNVSLNNPPPGITAAPINIAIGSTGNLVINTSQAASTAGLNFLNVLATSGFLNHTAGFSLAVHRLPGQFTRIKLLSPTGAGLQTFSCSARISAQVTPPAAPGAPFTVQFIRDGKAYPVQAVPFSGFLGFSPNCRVGVVVADASAPSSSPLGVYFFNLDFSVGATPIGGMINLTGSTYFWNDFLFSPDDSLLVMLGASGSGQTIDPNNPQPTNGAYVLDMLNQGNPGLINTFYGVGAYGTPVTACVDLLPAAGVAPTNGCTPVVGTLASKHPNQVRVTFAVNPGAPATVQRDPNGNAELFLIPPF
jgi:6-phosphogluconolactonase (cycloisomerase 2 family)